MYIMLLFFNYLTLFELDGFCEFNISSYIYN